MIASATKFKVKGIIEYFTFLRMTGNVIKQAKSSRGLVLIKANPFNLRTLTVWKDEMCMKEFRNSSHHLAAMKASANLGTTWSVTWNTNNVPTWRESVKKINSKINETKIV